MNIAIDLPNFPMSWEIIGGALQYAATRDDITITLPNAPLSHPVDRDPSSWDGAIVLFPNHELKIPQVCTTSAYSGETPWVRIIYSLVIRLAIEQFLTMGISSMGFFSQDDWRLGWNSFSRQAGEAGCHPFFISVEASKDVLPKMKKPCGILAFNDVLAFELLAICRELGLKAPGDVYIIAIQDTSACLKSVPQMSAISLPMNLVGSEAVRLCAELISGKPVKSPHIGIGPAGLIVRESCRIVNDDLKTAAEIAHYLRVNLDYPIQMEDILRRSSLSRRHLTRVFTSAYGMAPIAYLKKLRLEKAKKMLLDGNIKVKDIAETCGYRDTNHLCRIFREHVGLSPQAYALTHGKAAD